MVIILSMDAAPEKNLETTLRDKTQDKAQDKTHYVSVTGIIRRDGRYLICKRSEKEKAFPGKWCVPGGKIERADFEHLSKDTKDHWLDIFEKVLQKEIMEETNLTIANIGYCSSLVFIRPNGFSTIFRR